MCGILITFNEFDTNNLKHMLDAIKHRGPDTMEVESHGSHGIAACRLSIFGDPGAPMIYRDQSSGVTVLLNGEIYNYAELWDELEQDTGKKETDLEAELIARLYGRHGLEFVAKLKGMFALALFDQDRLILARDRFGIKPLYYTIRGRKVFVASEIKGILAHPDISPCLNCDSLKESAVFGYVADQESTFFEGINQVPPGGVMVFGPDGLNKKYRYASLPKAYYQDGKQCMPYEEACTAVRQKVIDTVERLFAHGNLDKGVYLSGGVDSSTMALVARNILGLPIQTFSMADDEENPDLQAARRVADELGTDHHAYLMRFEDYWPALVDYVAHYESLMAGGVFDIQGGVAFHLLCQRASRNVRVVFSGEGADELFGGYYWIYTHPLGFSDRIRGNLKPVMPNERIEGIVDNLFPAPENEALYRRNLFSFLLRGGLSNYHLQSVDRSAGAFGFEIRPAYLYDDVADYAMDLPIEFKVPDKHKTKMILRDAFRKDFEGAGIEFVHDRLKLGMPAAISSIDGEVHNAINQAISDEDLLKHPFGKILGSKMNLLCFDIFEQVFFKGWNHQNPEPPKDSLLARVWPG